MYKISGEHNARRIVLAKRPTNYVPYDPCFEVTKSPFCQLEFKIPLEFLIHKRSKDKSESASPKVTGKKQEQTHDGHNQAHCQR